MNSEPVVDARRGRFAARGVRSDDQSLVSLTAKVLKHPQHRVGDTVDTGQERLRDDRYSHAATTDKVDGLRRPSA